MLGLAALTHVAALLPSAGTLPRRWTRRESMLMPALLIPPLLPSAAFAASGEVTDRVRLEFVQQVSPEVTRVLPLTFGLYGADAPQSVAVFKSLCAGTLNVPCLKQDKSDDPLLQRSQLTRDSVYKACEGAVGVPVSYVSSQVWRIVQGKAIDAGQVSGKWALRAAPATPPNESASLSHDAAGLLSVRRGGRTFDFSITTSADTSRDAEFAVIGRVLDGEQILAEMDALPVVGFIGASDGAATDSSRGKACYYGSAESFCAQNKPLKKLTVARAAVL